jgi:ribose-phosphate pyrophosphokinase
MLLINGKELKFKEFPNGEYYLTDEEIYALRNPSNYMHYIVISLKFESHADLFNLYFIKKILEQYSITIDRLEIFYMPYSRMDRKSENKPFTLKVITDYINGLNFPHVTVYEPHSDVTPALLNHCKEYNVTSLLFNKHKDEIGFDDKRDYIMFPDAGAQKRYGKLFTGYNQIFGSKFRDSEGNVSRYRLIGHIVTDCKVVIIDDLCSYGNTFLQAAEAVRDNNGDAFVTSICLIVGHCEDSILKGKIPESDLIDKVFTTNSIISEGTDKVIVSDIKSLG